MISAGLPVLQSLNILSEQTEDKVFKDVLAKIRDDIGSGANLSDAMTKYPSIFSNLYCNMIKAGELSGSLDQILDRLSTYLEKAEALNQKIKGAMTYPITIVIIMFIVIVILLVKVVPTFSVVFASFGHGLPPMTQNLVDISNFEQHFAILQVAGIVALVFIFNVLQRTDKFGMIIDTYMLKVPVFGLLIKKQTVARFARTLGTLLKSGVQILDALETVARSSGNRLIEKALLDTRAAVREGSEPYRPFKGDKTVPVHGSADGVGRRGNGQTG